MGRLLALLLAFVAVLPACAGQPCPRAPEDLHEPELASRIGQGFVAGTAIPNRFVDSPEPEFQGYDLTITSRVAGLAEADQVMFVVAQDPVPGIVMGEPVLLVGIRGPRPAEISPAGGCPVLAPIEP